jgi:SAM-dependent methyltransferase
MPALKASSSVATVGAAIALAMWSSSATCRLARSQEPAGALATADGDEQQYDSQRPPPQTYMGRTIAPFMDASGADWLIRSTRNREEHPLKLLKALALTAGESVCDFGCGNGFYTLQLAKRVGPRGKIYAVDIQQEMLDQLRERMGARGLRNVELVLCTETDPKLPADQLDLVLMVDVYHELSHPPEVLKSVRASLRPRGRLVLVEFREEDPEVPIKPLHKMSQRQVNREISANGFKLVDQFDGLPWQHVLFFARDDSPLPAAKLRPWTDESSGE